MSAKQIVDNVSQKAVNSFLKNQINPNETIRKEVIARNIKSEDLIKRIVAQTNVNITQKLALNNIDDRAINFPLADFDVIATKIPYNAKKNKIINLDDFKYKKTKKTASSNEKLKNMLNNIDCNKHLFQYVEFKKTSALEIRDKLEDLIHERQKLANTIEEEVNKFNRDINKMAWYVYGKYGQQGAEHFIKCAKMSKIDKSRFDPSVSPILSKDMISNNFKHRVESFFTKLGRVENCLRYAGVKVVNKTKIRDLKPGEITHKHLSGRFKGTFVGRDEHGKYFVAAGNRKSKSFERPNDIPDSLIKVIKNNKGAK